MKLQSHRSRKIKGKSYNQWLVILPPKDIEALGWKEGDSLRAVVKQEGLLLVKGSEYDLFKEQIIKLLENNKTGLTWSEIQQKLELSQTVPNNRWVRRLEKENGLKRRKDGTNTYWFLPDESVVVYTIGYEGKSLDAMIGILKKHGIQQLIDVRELPLSRKNGFSKSILKKTLRENGIIYKHFPSLGAPREIRHDLWKEWDYKKFFKEYSDALNREESQEHLTDLKGLAHVRRTVLMCFERDVKKCHRSIIKEKLIKDGFKVVDL